MADPELPEVIDDDMVRRATVRSAQHLRAIRAILTWLVILALAGVAVGAVAAFG